MFLLLSPHSEIEQLINAKQKALRQNEMLAAQLTAANESVQELEESLVQADDKTSDSNKKLGILQGEGEVL